MLLNELEKKELIKPPSFLVSNTQYLTVMGSTAYGVNQGNSDKDLYGVCIPPRDYIFPPNYIDGFDTKDLNFVNWQKHHIKDPSANAGKGCSYDFDIYNIVKYFNLVADCNPNTLDSLFVRREHILHITKSWEVVRDSRKIFLHKGVVHRMRGYAYNQLSSARNCIQYVQPIRKFEEDNGISHLVTYEQVVNKTYENFNESTHKEYLMLWDIGIKKTKRFESQKIHNTDVKFLYHVFRLVDQAEFILHHFDLDLQEESRVAKMKAIRKGQFTYDQVAQEFSEAEKRLLDLYNTSALPKSPDRQAIRNLLLVTLEDHYGSLEKFVKYENANDLALKEIRQILNKYNL